MPFTLAHPIAVFPLRRILGRDTPVSALVIGSMAPDIAYFIPVGMERDFSHSLVGLFCFCLPAGVMTYVLYQILLKHPMVALLPAPWRLRAAHLLHPPTTHSIRRSVLVVLGVLAGAATHLAWDSFTHVDGAPVLAMPWLQTHLFNLGNYPIQAYRILQYVSSGLGMLATLAWLWRELGSSPGGHAPLPHLGPRMRRAVLTLLVALPAALGLTATLLAFEDYTVRGIRQAVAAGVYTALPCITLTFMAYAFAWHLFAAPRPRKGKSS